MPLTLNTNIDAFDSQRNMALVSDRFATAVRRLSSGLRISTAADDAAGLAISETITTQVKGFNQAGKNAQDAISMAQTAESALNQKSAMLQRMRELAVQASNDTYTDNDRRAVQNEIQQLVSELDRVNAQTDFNTKKLLDGSAGAATVDGGGAQIRAVTAQAGVALNGTFTIVQAQNALHAAVDSGGFPLGSAFTQTSAITIQGGLGTQTFTAFAGETMETFFQQVNNSGIGVTMGIDALRNNGASPGSEPVMITNKNWGSNDPLVGSPDGPNAVAVLAATGDFADTGLQIGFFAGGVNLTYQMAVDSTGLQQNTEASNAVLAIQGPTPFGFVPRVDLLTATGINSDVFQGSGRSSGISIIIADPGNITPIPVPTLRFAPLADTESFVVTQNAALQFQVGANANEGIGLNINSTSAQALGVSSLGVLTRADAETALVQLDRAVQQVSDVRAQIGAAVNRLTSAFQNDASSQEQALSANSSIRDVDVAQATLELTTDKILLEAGAAVLAQSNRLSKGLAGMLSLAINGGTSGH